MWSTRTSTCSIQVKFWQHLWLWDVHTKFQNTPGMHRTHNKGWTHTKLNAWLFVVISRKKVTFSTPLKGGFARKASKESVKILALLMIKKLKINVRCMAQEFIFFNFFFLFCFVCFFFIFVLLCFLFPTLTFANTFSWEIFIALSTKVFFFFDSL